MTGRPRKPRAPTNRPLARASLAEFPYWLGFSETQIRELADGRLSARVQKSARECLYPTWLRRRRKA